MFNWTITLTDKQILMLMAFASAEDDKYGNRVHAVYAMVSDAWDTRAVRRLQEDNLLSIREDTHPETGMKHMIWNITRKGQLIAEAIREDTTNLQQIKLRTGSTAQHAINQVDHKKWTERKEAKKTKPNPKKPSR